MASGTIIFLNGTSSAGKTTLAYALQERLEEPFQHVALDQFRDGLPAKFRGLNAPAGTPGERGLNIVPVKVAGDKAYTEVRFGEVGQKLLKGMRRAILTLALEGNNIIIDDIILNQSFLDDYLDVMANEQLYFVGVRCPLSVIEQRESQRLGRFQGQQKVILSRAMLMALTTYRSTPLPLRLRRVLSSSPNESRPAPLKHSGSYWLSNMVKQCWQYL